MGGLSRATNAGKSRRRRSDQPSGDANRRSKPWWALEAFRVVLERRLLTTHANLPDFCERRRGELK